MAIPARCFSTLPHTSNEEILWCLISNDRDIEYKSHIDESVWILCVSNKKLFVHPCPVAYIECKKHSAVMLATSKHGHCQHLAYQPPPPKDPLDLSRVWVDKENQTCWVENEDWNSSHKSNKVQLARVPNVDSKPPREVSTQCSCLPNFAKANHFRWLYFRNNKKLEKRLLTWPFLFKNRIPQYSHNPSNPFVLPLKNHTIFTISTLRSPNQV